jgi:hypothetical protein
VVAVVANSLDMLAYNLAALVVAVMVDRVLA